VETTQIAPFKPRAFPPRCLKERSIQPLLKKANDALEHFALTLPLVPPPLLSCLLQMDAIDSLNSQNLSIFFKELLQTSSKRKHQLAPIQDYLKALHQSAQKIKKNRFSKALICNIHNTLKRSSSHQKELGAFRNRQNWIGPAGCKMEEAYFYPPKVENVGPMMNILIRYMNKPTSEPLLQLALLFAQLLIIHPFMDGNGRVARSLVPLFLYKKNLLPTPFFLMSRYFKIHKLRYFQTLFQTTEEGNWGNWITFFLKGIIQSSKKTQRTLAHIHALHEQLKVAIPTLSERARVFLFQSPLFSTASLTRAGGSLSTLKQLEKQRYVRRLKNRRYLFAPLMKILYPK
jgi:Fic family protein